MITNVNLYGVENDVNYHSESLAKLGIVKQESELINKLITEYDFRVDVPVSIHTGTSGVTICFNTPKEITEQEQHLLIADIVRAFGVKLERKFSEYTGQFSFSGTIKELAYSMDVRVLVLDAKAKNCKVVAITEMKPVTRYVSDCSGGGEEAVEPQPVGEQTNE